MKWLGAPAGARVRCRLTQSMCIDTGEASHRGRVVSNCPTHVRRAEVHTKDEGYARDICVTHVVLAPSLADEVQGHATTTAH